MAELFQGQIAELTLQQEKLRDVIENQTQHIEELHSVSADQAREIDELIRHNNRKFDVISDIHTLIETVQNCLTEFFPLFRLRLSHRHDHPKSIAIDS